MLLAALTISAAAQDFLPELVKRIKPSAVAIETFDAKDNTIARGSGFFIAPDRIITNRHVIEKSSRVEVHLLNGKKFPVRGVLAIDGEGDLALLSVDVPKALAVPLPVVRAVPQEGESVDVDLVAPLLGCKPLEVAVQRLIERSLLLRGIGQGRDHVDYGRDE